MLRNGRCIDRPLLVAPRLRRLATRLHVMPIAFLLIGLLADDSKGYAQGGVVRPEQAGPALLRPPRDSPLPLQPAAQGDSAPAYPFAVPERALPGDVYWSKDFGRRGIYGTVFTACEHDGDLYVGGSFPYAGTTRCNNVARWDGVSWHPLGTGVWRDVGGTKVTRLLE